MKNLFDKTEIKGINMKNRFIRSASWEAMADKNGHLTYRLMKMYDELSMGGVATIITGYTSISRKNQPSPKMMGIYEDFFIEDYGNLTSMIHKNNCNIILQIAYGSFEAKHEKVYETITDEMSLNKIKEVVSTFGDAALRAKKANFDGIQFHCSHGEFLSEFLSPYYNKRTDEYGGNIENRTRIIFDICDDIIKKAGYDYPIFAKINFPDFEKKGITFEESKYICKELSKREIAGIEISLGTIPPIVEKDSMSNIIGKESVFRNYAKEIANEIDIPVILVGGNKSLDDMDDILKNSQIQYLSMARPLLCEPDLINKFACRKSRISKCLSCNKCWNTSGSVCVLNK